MDLFMKNIDEYCYANKIDHVTLTAMNQPVETIFLKYGFSREKNDIAKISPVGIPMEKKVC